MVVLPVVVATWWWNSKKYTRDRLLRQTVNLYYQYLRMQMPMRGVHGLKRTHKWAWAV
jgi:preprotein translocase subunit Sec63